MKNESKVFAPATVSNIGCGFDTIGFAIDSPGDIVIAKKTKTKNVTIKKITGDRGKLPIDTNLNTAGKSVLEFYNEVNPDFGISLEIHKKMSLGSGLGSSAASSVAAVVAANNLLSKPLKRNELLDFAIAGEMVASNALHADNVAPCLFGGIILIRDYNPIDIIKIKAPRELYCVVIHPSVEIKTSESRKLLKKSLPLVKARTQWGNVGALISGLHSSDYDLIGRSIVDEVAEGIRSKFIPHYDEIKSASMKDGALGVNISGSGPSIFALCKGEIAARNVGKTMKRILNRNGIINKVYISKVNSQGPRILD